jgi:hypothetical protein
MKLPDFITHYFESDKGPFRNICDLSDAEIASIIASERQAKTHIVARLEGRAAISLQSGVF